MAKYLIPQLAAVVIVGVPLVVAVGNAPAPLSSTRTVSLHRSHPLCKRPILSDRDGTGVSKGLDQPPLNPDLALHDLQFVDGVLGGRCELFEILALNPVHRGWFTTCTPEVLKPECLVPAPQPLAMDWLRFIPANRSSVLW